MDFNFDLKKMETEPIKKKGYLFYKINVVN